VNHGTISVNGGGADNNGTDNIVTTGTKGIIDNFGTFWVTGNLPQYQLWLNCDLPLVNDGPGAWLIIDCNFAYRFTEPGDQSGVSVLQKDGTTQISAGSTLQVDYGYTQQGGTLTTSGDGTASIFGVVRVHGGTVSMDGSTGVLYCSRDVTMDGGTLILNVDVMGATNNIWQSNRSITISGNAVIKVSTINIPPGPIPPVLWFILKPGTGSSANVTNTVDWQWDGFEWTQGPYGSSGTQSWVLEAPQ